MATRAQIATERAEKAAALAPSKKLRAQEELLSKNGKLQRELADISITLKNLGATIPSIYNVWAENLKNKSIGICTRAELW